MSIVQVSRSVQIYPPPREGEPLIPATLRGQSLADLTVNTARYPSVWTMQASLEDLTAPNSEGGQPDEVLISLQRHDIGLHRRTRKAVDHSISRAASFKKARRIALQRFACHSAERCLTSAALQNSFAILNRESTTYVVHYRDGVISAKSSFPDSYSLAGFDRLPPFLQAPEDPLHSSLCMQLAAFYTVLTAIQELLRTQRSPA